MDFLCLAFLYSKNIITFNKKAMKHLKKAIENFLCLNLAEYKEEHDIPKEEMWAISKFLYWLFTGKQKQD
jgi:hypothetical protein